MTPTLGLAFLRGYKETMLDSSCPNAPHPDSLTMNREGAVMPVIALGELETDRRLKALLYAVKTGQIDAPKRESGDTVVFSDR